MTHSVEDRLENVKLALTLMLELVGDDRYNCHFQVEQPEFKGIFPTSWHDMERDKLVYKSLRYYHLTGAGWIRGLEVTGKLKEPDFVKRMEDLAAALKNRLEGRRESEIVDLHVIATATRLPEGWLFNAIDSHLLAHAFNIIDASWAEPNGERLGLIKIPPDFGMRPLA